MYSTTHRSIPIIGIVLLLALCVPVRNSPQTGIQVEVKDVRERVNKLEVKVDDIPGQLASMRQRLDDMDKRDESWRNWTFSISGAVLAGLLTMIIERRMKIKG